jgi:hypothetical protein
MDLEEAGGPVVGVVLQALRFVSRPIRAVLMPGTSGLAYSPVNMRYIVAPKL